MNLTDTSLVRPNVHFISGLPRSGSTLLSTILSQNPRIRAGISTPVAGLIDAIIEKLSAKHEYFSLVTDSQRRVIARNVLYGYYFDAPQDVTIIDTSRSWAAKLPLVSELFTNARVVICVRNIGEIIASFEKLFSETPLAPSMILNYNGADNVYSRVEKLMSPTGLIGWTFNSAKDAAFGSYKDKVLILQYSSLVDKTYDCINAIYEHFGMETFHHSSTLKAVDYSRFDNNISTPRLHYVRSNIATATNNTIIPPDLLERYTDLNFWLEEENQKNCAKLI